MHLNLTPPLIEAGHSDELVKTGQSISSSFSPLDNSVAVFVTSTDTSSATGQSLQEDQPVYFASLDVLPSSERRLFITDTLIIFAALQNLKKTAESQKSNWIQGEQSLTMIRKLGIDYVNFIKECWVHASQPITRPEGPLQFSSDHYRSLYTCFSLFVVLYIAEPGYELAPVGDELIEWLNIHFIEPSTEEGDHLSALERPWEDESFWPYLTRTVLRGLSKASLFFLGVLAKHHSEDLQLVTEMLIPLIDAQPRLQNFTSERDFVYASRRWKDKVMALRVQMDRVPEDKRYDDSEIWWDRMSDIVGILEGRTEVIERVCEELGADWKELCVATSIFVDPRLRRQDLPDIMPSILETMPPDPTSLEDMVHAALFSGKLDQALQHASRLDSWLAAHLADIMEPLQLIASEIDEGSELSLRDQYILSYAEYLHSDSALWRITVDYMYSCGEIGKQQGDEVLVRVPLGLYETSSASDDKIRAGDVVGTLKDINETCFDYARESVRRNICKIAAQSFVRHHDFGLAVSYCTSAEDWPGLGRVVDRVLDEYINSGPQKFTDYALAIAPFVQELRNQSKSQGVFVHRLTFAVQYARFHELLSKHEYHDAASDLVTILHEDLAPKSWWAVLLHDAVQLLQYGPALLFTSQGASLLMRKLEEVNVAVRTSKGSTDDNLRVISRVMNVRGSKEALDCLNVVRLALARYLARCTIHGVEAG